MPLPCQSRRMKEDSFAGAAARSYTRASGARCGGSSRNPKIRAGELNKACRSGRFKLVDVSLLKPSPPDGSFRALIHRPPRHERRSNVEKPGVKREGHLRHHIEPLPLHAFLPLEINETRLERKIKRTRPYVLARRGKSASGEPLQTPSSFFKSKLSKTLA